MESEEIKSANTYSQIFLTKLKNLGFDIWDIKDQDLDYVFGEHKFRVLFDFFISNINHDKVLTDEELIWFNDICKTVVDKIKSQRMFGKTWKQAKNDFSDDLFSLDSFDDDNLLMLDDIEKETTAMKTEYTSKDLDIINEEFDDFEDVLSDMDSRNIETMISKLDVELNRDPIEQYLEIDTDNTLKQQSIILESELKLLEKEEKLLQLELEELEKENPFIVHSQDKENIVYNSNNLSAPNIGKSLFKKVTDSNLPQEKLENEIEQFTNEAKDTLSTIGANLMNFVNMMLPNVDTTIINYDEFYEQNIDNIQKISMKSIQEFAHNMTTFVNRLSNLHDNKMNELKNNSNKGIDGEDHEMSPLIVSTYDIEK